MCDMYDDVVTLATPHVDDSYFFFFFFFQAEDGIRDLTVTGVQTCALPICRSGWRRTSGTCGRPPTGSSRIPPAERTRCGSRPHCTGSGSGWGTIGERARASGRHSRGPAGGAPRGGGGGPPSPGRRRGPPGG